MQLFACGILTDHLNRVLLFTRAESGLLFPPIVALAPGRLPDVHLSDKIRDTTGLIVLPVRLTALSHGRRGSADSLTFSFRCLLRGGGLREEAATSAGFFDAQPLPGPMLARDRRLLDQALHHTGDQAAWEVEPRDLASVVRGWLAGTAIEPQSPDWDADARVVVRSDDGRVALRADNDGLSRYPGDRLRSREAPWQAAARVLEPFGGGKVTGLPGVIFDREGPRITFLFSAVRTGGALPPGFLPGDAELPTEQATTFFSLAGSDLSS